MHTQQKIWPILDYQQFQSTQHLLHMFTQMMGKCKLLTPFEPHWANVALWLTCRGLTTGPISYQSEFFSIDLDVIESKITIHLSSGLTNQFKISSMSVAQFYDQLMESLTKLKIHLTLNTKPQEISNPIAFEKDTQKYIYEKELALNWWHILLNTYSVLKKFHARFDGETPPIGLMWGTFDLRDARYNGKFVQPEGINSGYLRRNAMNEEQVESGWWPGNEMYPKPAFFSFAYPQPKNIETAKIEPQEAYWHSTLSEFILDYEYVQQSSQPDKILEAFFESAYQKAAEFAHWNKTLLTSGTPK